MILGHIRVKNNLKMKEKKQGVLNIIKLFVGMYLLQMDKIFQILLA